jgi:hypothetical protein
MGRRLLRGIEVGGCEGWDTLLGDCERVEGEVLRG